MTGNEDRQQYKAVHSSAKQYKAVQTIPKNNPEPGHTVFNTASSTVQYSTASSTEQYIIRTPMTHQLDTA
jgi:hypothetical protein